LASKKKIHTEAKNGIKMKVPKEVPLSCQSHIFEARGIQEKEKRAGNTGLERTINKGERKILDQIIAKMFYTAGLPFNLARNPYYIKAFLLVYFLEDLHDASIKSVIYHFSYY
jgi:hypothetical protein